MEKRIVFSDGFRKELPLYQPEKSPFRPWIMPILVEPIRVAPIMTTTRTTASIIVILITLEGVNGDLFIITRYNPLILVITAQADM